LAWLYECSDFLQKIEKWVGFGEIFQVKKKFWAGFGKKIRGKLLKIKKREILSLPASPLLRFFFPANPDSDSTWSRRPF